MDPAQGENSHRTFFIDTRNTRTEDTVVDKVLFKLFFNEQDLYMGFIISADMAVDPGGELGDPGVNPRQVRPTTARPPAHNPYEEPATIF